MTTDTTAVPAGWEHLPVGHRDTLRTWADNARRTAGQRHDQLNDAPSTWDLDSLTRRRTEADLLTLAVNAGPEKAASKAATSIRRDLGLGSVGAWESATSHAQAAAALNVLEILHGVGVPADVIGRALLGIRDDER